ncbi:MAG: FKBP-type peptidyl-prolyl cis-trans isomerase [Chitinophagaceae bacterium]
MKKLIMAAATIIIIASCNANYEKTPSGILYKITPGKPGGAKLNVGQFVKIDVQYTIHKNNKDSVLNTTNGRIPSYAPVDTGAKYKYSFVELLPKCSVGDEVEFVLSVDTLKKSGAIPNYTKDFAAGDMIHGKMKILKAFNSEQEIMADYQKESDAEKTRETTDLENYLSKKGIKAERSPNGVFIVVQNAGDLTNKVDSGKQVSIMYKGYFENTNKVFDTNMDTSKGHTAPIQLVIGQHQSLPGWEEGLKYFGKGGKGTIYIPAMMAYGPQGRGPEMPPYSNLIFDIEVKDVTVAPKQSPQQNPYGNLTPQQMQQLQQEMQRQQQQKDSTHH